MSGNTHAMREFIAEAEKIGYTLIGYDGHGHPRLRHTSGVTASISRTPSDYRGRRNELARLERLSGQKAVRPNSGHFRAVRMARSSFTARTAAERAAAARVDELLAQASDLRGQWADLTDRPEHRDGAAAARSVLKAFEEVRAELAELHRHIPAITALPSGGDR